MVSEAKVTTNANKEQLALVNIIHQPIAAEVKNNLKAYGELKITNTDELLAATHIRGKIAGLKAASRLLGVEIEEASYGATFSANGDRLNELAKQLREALCGCSCKDAEKERPNPKKGGSAKP